MTRKILSINLLLLFLICFCTLAGQSLAVEPSTQELKNFLMTLDRQCKNYGWKDIRLTGIPWEYYRTSAQKNPLIFAVFGDYKNNCILFLGGVHGDESPTVYVLLKFANYIRDNPNYFKDKCVIIAPLINPDGFFANPPLRTNAGGIDLNRNFPTHDWQAMAWKQWKSKGQMNKRYFPGNKPASEQETLFQMALINRFKPQKILTMHSPLGFYDFDGPSSNLDSFEHWMEKVSQETQYPLKKFGYFPGSLGNYAGHERKIFTLTLELPSSAPQRGIEFFNKFQPAIVKFFDLRVLGKEPYIRLADKNINVQK
ncbi:MAG: M14 family zinc carboxypeptidase [Smithella sp.]